MACHSCAPCDDMGALALTCTLGQVNKVVTPRPLQYPDQLSTASIHLM